MLMCACAEDSGAPVTITNVKILAPIPGSSASVAYFTINNRGDTSITVDRIDSPQYDNVEMHETTLDDGISRMRPIESFQVDPSSSIEFAPGGKHVMLMRPTANIVPGSSVALEFNYDNGLLIVSAILQNRLPAE